MPEQKPTLVKHAAWGKMEVTIGSETREFRDCKVWPGGATEWDWRLTGTEHRPGIQPADIEEILQHDVQVIVLARGAMLRLGVCVETEELLRDRGIEYHVKQTKKAVQLFNSLSKQGRRVGGIFHSTC
jgi:hypothetical protein